MRYLPKLHRVRKNNLIIIARKKAVNGFIRFIANDTISHY
jgi:hypothetical protein